MLCREAFSYATGVNRVEALGQLRAVISFVHSPFIVQRPFHSIGPPARHLVYAGVFRIIMRADMLSLVCNDAP